MTVKDLNLDKLSRRSVLVGSTTAVFATATANGIQAATVKNQTNMNALPRAPFPPFTKDTATQKVRGAEDGWNNKKPEKVSMAYSPNSIWRNRAEFISGREEIIEFLTRKWNKELDYRLIKELWAYNNNSIAVRFAYEYHNDSGDWFRAYGNENWEFDESGLMKMRFASINDYDIEEHDRKFHWPNGPRPSNHPGLSDLGL